MILPDSGNLAPPSVRLKAMTYKILVRDPDGQWRDHDGMADGETILYATVEAAEADIQQLAPFQERQAEDYRIVGV